MRLCAIVACGLSVAGVMAAPQQPPAPFKSGVTLVTIDVTVLDRDGLPVPGLTAQDFAVRLNGREQPVRALTYVQSIATTAAAPMAGAVGPAFDASPVTPATPGANAAGSPRLFIVFVDDLSFAASRGKSLFAAARRFVDELSPADLVGVATSSGTRIVNPTRDRAAVRTALDTVVGEFSDPRAIDRSAPIGRSNASPDQTLGIAQSLDIERGDASALKDAISRECFNGSRAEVDAQTLDQLVAGNQCASAVRNDARRIAGLTQQTTGRQLQAYQSVIKAMGAAAGIKHLLLLTDGLGISQDTPAVAPVARAAAEAGVQMSVLIEDADPSMTDAGRRTTGSAAPQGDPGLSQRRREDAFMLASGAQTVADMTGGTFYRVTGTPDPFFRRVAAAASALYRLAVELPADTAPGRDFALAATVRRPGLSAHANRHAVAPAATSSVTAPAASSPRANTPAPSAPLSLDEQLRAAIATGRARSEVPIAIAKALRRAQDAAQVDIGVRLDVPATVKGPLTAMFGLVDDAGSIRSAKKTIDAPSGESYAMAFSIPVAPGRYRLRFVVADAAGAIGAVESVVDAHLAVMGPLTASDLLLSTVAADGTDAAAPAAQALPADARTLTASLELYPGAPGAVAGDILVKLTLASSGEPQAGIERVVTPETVDGTLRAEAEFPLERLAPGTYAIQATVMVGANAIGTASATFTRK
jgi:VWFA-related protein